MTATFGGTALGRGDIWGNLGSIEFEFLRMKVRPTNERYSSSHIFCEIVVLKIFTKFTRKHLREFFFHKLVGFQPATLLKRRLWQRCFPGICEIFENIYFMEHLQFAASEMRYFLGKQNSLTGKAFTLLIKKVTIYMLFENYHCIWKCSRSGLAEGKV